MTISRVGVIGVITKCHQKTLKRKRFKSGSIQNTKLSFERKPHNENRIPA